MMRIGFFPIRRAGIVLLLCSSFCTLYAAHVNATDETNFSQSSASEQYETALSMIKARSFSEALALLRRIQANFPGFEKISSVQTRIAVLQESQDATAEIGHYLGALDKRDAGDASGAISSLDFILLQYPDSTLADDALYLKAYVQVMDRYDFAGAQATLRVLEQRFPESSYQDSAEYLFAISMEQIGETEQAKVALENLRDRHTAFTLPFGYSWPEGNVLSRYWYDRADKRLDIIDQVDASASQLRSKQSLDSDRLTVAVNVNGVDLEFDLSSSPLTLETQWKDGQLQDQSPPVAGVFVGTVVGDDDSWVRAVIVDDTISGVAYAYGNTYTMQSGTLIGTLDYYQPRSAKSRNAGVVDAVSTEAEVGHDGLVPPPQLGAAFAGELIPTAHSDLRVVPLSIVLDAEFDRYHGGNGLIVALNQLNVADGIYRKFGLALAVDEVQVYGDTDYSPLLAEPSTLESYLLDFRDYRQDKKTLFNDSVLTYLFTGKQRTDTTLGLAWIDTLCRTDGYDVGITTPSAIGEVLLTHELGHSLGSAHDSDTSCNQDTTKIMWPHISSRTSVEFSRCSSESVSHAHGKSCLVNAVDVSLNAIGTDSGVEFIIGNLDTTVGVEANLIIETSSANLLSYPAGCNITSPTSATCVVGEVGAGGETRIAVQVAAASSFESAVVSAEVAAVATIDFVPLNNTVTYSIDMQSIIPESLILANSSSANSLTALSGLTGDSESTQTSGGGMISKAGLLILSLLQFVTAVRALRV